MEAVTTDPGVSRSFAGQFNYWEVIQKEGYTNKGFIMGDWIGREAKGGQAWMTYHLSGDEMGSIRISEQEDAKDFVPRRNDAEPVQGNVVKRFGPGGRVERLGAV